MRKLLAIVTMVCFMLSMGAVAFADQSDVAAISPFSDVPKNHWAYSAIQQLQKDGVITGYDNEKYNGNQNITRYECAMMISAAMAKLRSEMSTKGAALIAAVPQPGQTKEQAAAAQAKLDASIANISKQDRALIQKLAAEFAAELDAMGVKVDAIGADLGKIETKIDRMPKMSWAAQIQVDPQMQPFFDKTNSQGWTTTTNPNTLLWLSPMVNGYIDGNWRYYGELRFNAPLISGVTGSGDPAGNTIGGSQKGIATIDLRNAYAYGNGLGATWYIGRFEDNLPFTNVAGRGGLVSDDRLDGIRAAFVAGNFRGDVFGGYSISGYGQISANDDPLKPASSSGNSAMMCGIDSAYNYGPGNVYAAWYMGMGQKGSKTPSTPYIQPFDNYANPLNFFELGLDYQLTPKVTATAYAASNASPAAVANQTSNNLPSFATGQNLSWLARLDYGSFSAKQQGSMGFYAMYASTGANAVFNSPNYDVSGLSWVTKSKQVDPVTGAVTYPYAYGGMNGNAAGFEVGCDWAPAQNMDWHLSWSMTNAIDATMAAYVAGVAVNGGNNPMNQTRNIFKSEYTFMF